MTIRNNTDEQPAGDGHQRFARYQQELAQASEANEIALVSAILRDQDATMAQSAVVGHLDRRANELLTDSRFLDWADNMAPLIAQREFLTRRLHEWTLLRTITTDDTWSAEDVLSASDWFQRKIAQTATSPAVLTLLASRGRTRRVRNTARQQLTRQGS